MNKDKILITCLMILFIIGSIIIHINQKKVSDHTHPHHEKARILYYEGGPYYDYRNNLISLFEGLIEQKIIDPINFMDLIKDSSSEDNRQVWDYICDNLESDHIIMNKGDFYSSNWDESLRSKTKETVLSRLKDPTEFKLVIAMGTWAGLDLVNNDHNVNTMVISTTDALRAGIIKEMNDSRFPHVFVEYDPYIYYQQLKLFYSIFQFNKLGLVFTDSLDGRTYVAYDDVMKLSKEKGFEVVKCNVNGYEQDMKVLIEEGKACVDELSSQVDAMYFGDQTFMKYDHMPYVIIATIKNKVPTWSHHGIEHVRRGILMSKSHEHQFKNKGKWQAKIFNKIIHNLQEPYKINGIWDDKTELAINMAVAKKIGFDVPPAILKISNKIFNSIEGIADGE